MSMDGSLPLIILIQGLNAVFPVVLSAEPYRDEGILTDE